MSTPTVKIVNTPDLLWLNAEAVKAKRNRSFTDNIGDLLDPDGIHVVSWSMVHNDREIRAMFMLKFKNEENPVRGWLDMSFEDFEGLAEVDAS